MRKTVVLIIMILTVPVFELVGRSSIKFYNLASVKTVKGQVIAISQENESAQAPFIVITLKEQFNGRIYRVEVSPEWFFRIDLMQGSSVEITGSDISSNDRLILIAGTIKFQGEQYEFRDAKGFPLWRGPRNQKDFAKREQKRRRDRN